MRRHRRVVARVVLIVVITLWIFIGGPVLFFVEWGVTGDGTIPPEKLRLAALVGNAYLAILVAMVLILAATFLPTDVLGRTARLHDGRFASRASSAFDPPTFHDVPARHLARTQSRFAAFGWRWPDAFGSRRHGFFVGLAISAWLGSLLIPVRPVPLGASFQDAMPIAQVIRAITEIPDHTTAFATGVIVAVVVLYAGVPMGLAFLRIGRARFALWLAVTMGSLVLLNLVVGPGDTRPIVAMLTPLGYAALAAAALT
jgi:hypothetical protein